MKENSLSADLYLTTENTEVNHKDHRILLNVIPNKVSLCPLSKTMCSLWLI